MKLRRLLAAMALILGFQTAHASVAVLLEMPYGSLGAFNPTGHTALYFDHICAATPLELRPCAPGELGVVISRYDGIGTLDWVAMPLVPYLYGVRTADEVPSTMDALTALRLRDLYRRQYLETVAPDTADGGMPAGNWYELVGAAYDRDIYGFQVKTTAEQDAALIAYFNDRPNVTRYEGAFRNCADFARVVINRLYPHAVHRNYVADFGLTTPKSVARSLVHYGRRHPDTELTMFRVPQVEGPMPRSMGIQGVAGSLLTRYGVPLLILSPHVTAVVLVAYVGKGRFAVPKHAPVLDVQRMEMAASQQATLAAQMDSALSDIGPQTTSARSTGLASGSISGFAGAADDDALTLLPVGTVCSSCDAVPYLP